MSPEAERTLGLLLGEDWLRPAISQTPVMLYVLDLDWRFVLAEGEGFRGWPRSAKEILGHRLQEYVPPESPTIPPIERALRGETVREVIHYAGERYGGRYLDSWFSPLRDRGGSTVGVIGLSFEVTEQKRAEEKLRRSEELNRSIIDAVPCGIVLVGTDRRVLRANHEAERFLRLKREEVSGSLVGEHGGLSIHEDGSARPVEEWTVTRCLETGQPQPRQLGGIKFPDGAVNWGLFGSVPAHDPKDGSLIGAMVTILDVTEQRRAAEERAALEEQLRQAQKLEAVGRLAGGIAHDFNNLLSGVLGHASLLRAEANPGSDTDRALETIELAAERAAELTRRLLGFARKGKFRSVPVDLYRALREVADLIGPRFHDRKIDIQLKAPNGPVVTVGDPVQIHQVLLNLAINACDAMPEGGSLGLDVEATHVRDPKLGPDSPPTPIAVVTVSDTGTGIAPAVREHIFEPFFTTKDPGHGTGMGLAMVYGIVRNHGGWIQVSSALGKGSTFTVHLPRSEAQPARETRTPSGPISKEALQPARILVVDDEEIVRLTAQRILSALGYEVVAVPNTAAAIGEIQKRGFDLAVIDMVMPGCSGSDCFAELKRADPELRAVLSSGFAEEDLVQPLLDRDMRGFAQKPYRADELARVIERALIRS
jgi:PAS domain S-box-containing protein